jgi:hypothetical protein
MQQNWRLEISSGDVMRGEYDNMEVEAKKGNFTRKSHKNNSRIIEQQ